MLQPLSQQLQHIDRDYERLIKATEARIERDQQTSSKKKRSFTTSSQNLIVPEKPKLILLNKDIGEQFGSQTQLLAAVIEQSFYGLESIYKFITPAQKHGLYRVGDSLAERCKMSRNTINKYFSNIGVIYDDRDEFLNAQKEGDPFLGKLYARFYARRNGVSIFLRNEELADSFFPHTRKNGYRRQKGGAEQFAYGTPNGGKREEIVLPNTQQQDISPESEKQKAYDSSTSSRSRSRYSNKETKTKTPEGLAFEERGQEMYVIWQQVVGTPIAMNNRDQLTDEIAERLGCALNSHFNDQISQWQAHCNKIASSQYLMGEAPNREYFRYFLTKAIKKDEIEMVLAGKKYKFGNRERPLSSQEYSVENQQRHLSEKLQSLLQTKEDVRLEIDHARRKIRLKAIETMENSEKEFHFQSFVIEQEQKGYLLPFLSSSDPWNTLNDMDRILWESFLMTQVNDRLFSENETEEWKRRVHELQIDAQIDSLQKEIEDRSHGEENTPNTPEIPYVPSSILPEMMVRNSRSPSSNFDGRINTYRTDLTSLEGGHRQGENQKSEEAEITPSDNGGTTVEESPMREGSGETPSVSFSTEIPDDETEMLASRRDNKETVISRHPNKSCSEERLPETIEQPPYSEQMLRIWKEIVKTPIAITNRHKLTKQIRQKLEHSLATDFDGNMDLWREFCTQIAQKNQTQEKRLFLLKALNQTIIPDLSGNDNLRTTPDRKPKKKPVFGLRIVETKLLTSECDEVFDPLVEMLNEEMMKIYTPQDWIGIPDDPRYPRPDLPLYGRISSLRDLSEAKRQIWIAGELWRRQKDELPQKIVNDIENDQELRADFEESSQKLDCHYGEILRELGWEWEYANYYFWMHVSWSDRGQEIGLRALMDNWIDWIEKERDFKNSFVLSIVNDL